MKNSSTSVWHQKNAPSRNGYHEETTNMAGRCGEDTVKWGPYFSQGLCWCPWPRYCQRPCRCTIICVSPETMLMSKAMMVSLLCAAKEGRVDACGQYCHWRPCWSVWHLLTLEAMWMSVLHAVTRNSSCCYQKPYVSPWSMHLLTVKGSEATLPWYWLLQTYSWERGTMNSSVTTPIPTLPPHPPPKE